MRSRASDPGFSHASLVRLALPLWSDQLLLEFQREQINRCRGGGLQPVSEIRDREKRGKQVY